MLFCHFLSYAMFKENLIWSLSGQFISTTAEVHASDQIKCTKKLDSTSQQALQVYAASLVKNFYLPKT